jgi:hypothetical protein
MPPDPPRMSHAFGARLHDHSHDAGFDTDCIELFIHMLIEHILIKHFTRHNKAFYKDYFMISSLIDVLKQACDIM